MKSNFESIVPEDFKQYRQIADRFQKVQMEDCDTLNRLSIDAWIIACRWNNISSNSRKIAEEYNVSKTDFCDWSYHIYSLLKELHITTRSWYNNAIKDYELNKMIKGD
jgi:hypothetical protein